MYWSSDNAVVENEGGWRVFMHGTVHLELNWSQPSKTCHALSKPSTTSSSSFWYLPLQSTKHMPSRINTRLLITVCFVTYLLCYITVINSTSYCHYLCKRVNLVSEIMRSQTLEGRYWILTIVHYYTSPNPLYITKSIAKS